MSVDCVLNRTTSCGPVWNTSPPRVGEAPRSLSHASLGRSHWYSYSVCWKLKGKLFSALVLSIVLFIAEVWPLKKD